VKVLIVSKILVVAAYRRKLDEIAAQPDIDHLVVVTAPAWQEPGGRRLAFETSLGKRAYDLRVEPILFNGSYHLFVWPWLARVMREVKPDLVHIDEEPYNLATAHATWLARRLHTRSLFFTWQNLLRRYPPPFSMFERYTFNHSACAIAGSHEALRVVHAKGYAGPVSVIPQFGVDPNLFAPLPTMPHAGPPVIGFIARLVEEKGILVLLDALAGLQGEWRLHVIGSGPLEPGVRKRAAELRLSERITWERAVPSELIPERLRTFSVLVQPSLTRKHWKEQFGRAGMEAMSCGIAVVGSDSGEIPNVVGDAGLVVPEGNPLALREAIARLLGDDTLRQDLGRRGRERVLKCYTHRRVADQTVRAYRSVVGAAANSPGQVIAS
jgi:glycosyltransferase involved in cell wall biosynthesis